MKRYLLLAFALFVLSANAKASSLFGRVIEVSSGDVITVFNLNRPVRVKLLGVDAPEMDQLFGDVAKKHLSDLVYDKSVLVHYSGIAADHSLTGRVLLDNTDIGAQMIRDGAAWFDANNQSRLTATDREVYQQSEQAARNERRGLWQAEKPMAPWEFVRAEAVRKNPHASLNSILPASKARRDGPVPELTNLTLLTRAAATAPNASSLGVSDADLAWAMPATARKNWQQLRPEGEHFSALVPEQGKQVKKPLPLGERTIDVNAYMARDGWAIYSVMWLTGPTYGETDKSALTGALQGFLKGVGQGYESTAKRPGFNCEPQGEKNISSNGYTGTEYDLTTCSVPTRLRAFTKVVGDQRQLYVGAVLYMEEDPNVSRFLQSFRVDPTPKTGSRKR